MLCTWKILKNKRKQNILKKRNLKNEKLRYMLISVHVFFILSYFYLFFICYISNCETINGKARDSWCIV